MRNFKIHNRSCKIKWEIDKIHNRSCKIKWEIDKIHNRLCKIKWEIDKIHNRLCKTEWEIDKIHNRSCKIKWNEEKRTQNQKYQIDSEGVTWSVPRDSAGCYNNVTWTADEQTGKNKIAIRI
jgi:uncharacterized coiled-coil DUF342 family protein